MESMQIFIRQYSGFAYMILCLRLSFFFYLMLDFLHVFDHFEVFDENAHKITHIRKALEFNLSDTIQ